MTRNRRQCSTASGVMVGLIRFMPLSVTAMVPVEAHLIPVSQKVAPATVLRSSVSVAEHPLTGETPPTRSARLLKMMNLR